MSIEPAIAEPSTDLGPYPGLVDGDQLVLGEVWTFRAEDLRETLAVLDRIEGFDPKGDSGEYVRQVIQVEIIPAHQSSTRAAAASREGKPAENATLSAWTYLYNEPARLDLADRGLDRSGRVLGVPVARPDVESPP